MCEFVLRCSDICCEKVFDFLLFVISGTTCFLFSELPSRPRTWGCDMSKHRAAYSGAAVEVDADDSGDDML